MLQSAIDCGYLDRGSRNDLLRHKFWTLSCETLESQTRHKYTIRSFDELLREIRQVEKKLSIIVFNTSKRVHEQSLTTENVDRDASNLEQV